MFNIYKICLISSLIWQLLSLCSILYFVPFDLKPLHQALTASPCICNVTVKDVGSKLFRLRRPSSQSSSSDRYRGEFSATDKY